MSDVKLVSDLPSSHWIHATAEPSPARKELAKMIDTILDAGWQQATVLMEYIHAKNGQIKQIAEGTLNGDQTKAESERDKLRADLAELQEDTIKPMEQAWRNYGRWPRYYMVKGGHVHKSASCTTCYPTTIFAWLPTLSDEPMEKMVEEWGEQACTVCFPEAPTLPRFAGKSRLDERTEATRLEREASKQATRKRLARAKVIKAYIDEVIEALFLRLELSQKYREDWNYRAGYIDEKMANARDAYDALSAIDFETYKLAFFNAKAKRKWNRSGLQKDQQWGAVVYVGVKWVNQDLMDPRPKQRKS